MRPSPGPKGRLVLDEIDRRGGMTLAEIQRFVCNLNGLNYDADDGWGNRRYRGYWCTNLYGGSVWKRDPDNPILGKIVRRPGLLYQFCVKEGKVWKLRTT